MLNQAATALSLRVQGRESARSFAQKPNSSQFALTVLFQAGSIALSSRRARRARTSVSVYAVTTRDRDRIKPFDDLKLSSLIDGVTANDLVEEISALAEDGMASKEEVNRLAALNGRLHLVLN